jgi:hypothetical protein
MYKYRTMADATAAIRARIEAADPATVWTPVDFLDLGTRDAVDKTLQRLAGAGTLRRIDRGLYDRPAISSLTKAPRTPDYRKVLDALARRDQARMLIDGLTAANDLGLTTAVPARVVVHTDMRRRSIPLGNLTIAFRFTAPSKLYWAGRPAMRVVQALYWLKDMLGSDTDAMLSRLAAVLADPAHGVAIREDLRVGVRTLPAWMQQIVRSLLDAAADTASDTPPARDLARETASRRRGGGSRSGGPRVSRSRASGERR